MSPVIQLCEGTYVIQTLDVQVQESRPQERLHKKGGLNGGELLSLNEKPGAKTARNGSSFLAMIEKMIAGSMEGNQSADMAALVKKAARGAGDKTPVPGETNTHNKDGTRLFSFDLKDEKQNSVRKKTMQVDVLNRKAGNINHLMQEKMNGSSGLNEIETDGSIKKELLVKGKKQTGLAEDKFSALSVVSSGVNLGPASVNLFPVSAINKGRNSQINEESEKAEGLTEVKNGKKEKKISIGVRDERTESLLKTPSLFEKKVQINDDNSADISIGFPASGSGTESSGTAAQIAENKEAQGKNFASMLSQELQSSASDFVKTGQIVLRDNNSGIIRLNLHPESLGNVQIKLELHDKKISGKIIVNSREAFEAFNESMDGLNDAFIEGGFESGGFDLSWSGNDSEEQKQSDAATRAITPFYASSIPDVMSATETADILNSGYRSQNRSAINFFA